MGFWSAAAAAVPAKEASSKIGERTRGRERRRIAQCVDYDGMGVVEEQN